MKVKSLDQQLFDEPEKFDFFQAVRLLEHLFPERVPVARGAMPREEVVGFRSFVSLRFPPSQIHSLSAVAVENETTKPEMYINFMGMVGIAGALPMHYTELVADRIRYRDNALAAFLDIFTHRSVSLFFRSWEKYRFPVQYERGNDDFTSYLFDIIGLGTKGLRGRMSLPDESLIPYGGLIAQKPHSSIALEQILSDYFKIKAKIEQFFGQWIGLDGENLSKVGEQNHRLGSSTILGTRIWDSRSKFRITLGALRFQEFQAFLPNGSAHQALLSIVKFMVGMEYDFDVKLRLRAKEVPGCILTTRAKRRPMLGWTSWLKTKPFENDDEQVILGLGQTAD